MTLPTFLGIGVPRAGTTWLHTLLAAHPEVYLPERRKEVRFFDRYYEHGLAWYETFFCPPEEAHRYKAVGEISPQYLYCEECPSRIAAALPTVKLLVMLRHPVDRAYSQYGFVVQRQNYTGSFEQFLSSRPQALERGFYSRYLRGYLAHFERRAMLPLLFEEAVLNGDSARGAIASFLSVPVDGFPSSLGKVNPSSVPRFPILSSFAVKMARQLRRRHLESVVDLGGRLGLGRALTKGRPLPQLDAGLRRDLSRRFEREFEELEDCLQVDVSRWRE